jgi:hypothetical protein
MKKILTNLFTIAGASLITISSYAQMADNSELLDVIDLKQNNNLPAGLDPRISIATDQPVEWSKSPYGYAASYTLDNTHYMATYDNESHYVETFKKIDWTSLEVSSVVKYSILTSAYKDQKVIAYWESSDPTEYGYYLEIKDKTGKQSNIWADTKGNFYNKPYEYNMVTLSKAE